METRVSLKYFVNGCRHGENKDVKKLSEEHTL